MVIPQYDEFGIFIDDREIELYVDSLLEKGIDKVEDLINICEKKFGKYSIDRFEYIIFNKKNLYK